MRKKKYDQPNKLKSFPLDLNVSGGFGCTTTATGRYQLAAMQQHFYRHFMAFLSFIVHIHMVELEQYACFTVLLATHTQTHGHVQ